MNGMKINGFRCDGCGKEVLLDIGLIIEHYLGVIPDGWYMVTLPGMRALWLFCSQECLRSHPLALPVMKEVANEQAPTPQTTDA